MQQDKISDSTGDVNGILDRTDDIPTADRGRPIDSRLMETCGKETVKNR
jgi:hypothetical protein